MDEEIDLLELMKFVKRKWNISLIVFILSMIVCNLYFFLKIGVSKVISLETLKTELLLVLISIVATLIVLLIIIYCFDRSIKSIEQLKQYNLLESIKNENDIIKVKTKIKLREQGKVIFLTSPKNGENEKILMNLAKEFNKDSKVLVINADFRNGQSKKEGYSDILKKYPNTIKTFIRKKDGIDIIDIGTTLEEPEVLLYSDNNKKLLEELKNVYDYILIYDFNIVDYSDALILSKISDSNYIVVELYKTNREDLDKSISSFEQISVKIDGIIALLDK